MPAPLLHTEFTDNGFSIKFSSIQNDLIHRSTTAPKSTITVQKTATSVIVTIANNHQSYSWDETQAANYGYGNLETLYDALVVILGSDQPL